MEAHTVSALYMWWEGPNTNPGARSGQRSGPGAGSCRETTDGGGTLRLTDSSVLQWATWRMGPTIEWLCRGGSVAWLVRRLMSATCIPPKSPRHRVSIWEEQDKGNRQFRPNFKGNLSPWFTLTNTHSNSNQQLTWTRITTLSIHVVAFPLDPVRLRFWCFSHGYIDTSVFVFNSTSVRVSTHLSGRCVCLC